SPRHSRVNLEQVPAGGILLTNHLLRTFGRGGRIPVEAWSRQVEHRRHHLSPRGTRPQLQLALGAKHAPNGGDSVGHVEKEYVVGELRWRVRRWHVAMHLCQSGCEELALALHHTRSGGH